MPFSQVIEQERRRWMPFRQAWSKEDQEVFDRMFACAKQQLQAEVRLGRPWRFEAVFMAVLLWDEKRLDQIQGVWRPSGTGMTHDLATSLDPRSQLSLPLRVALGRAL